ncbi:STY0301 family protein [Paraburkholderia flava]|uniref:STY0301 family protein n=1 Tax=Paraburkholderia flava TaxID=2547393 RepID=UPI00105D6D27|nr:STY0301 family protein [Paraburkholderia flava]
MRGFTANATHRIELNEGNSVNAGSIRMKLTVWLVFAFTVPVVHAYELVCPAKAPISANVKSAPDGWSASQRADGLWVDGLIVTDGPPADRGDLKPEGAEGKGTVVWDLSGDHTGRSYWASCSYGKWLVLLSKKLPDGISRCSSAPLKVDASGNPVVRLQCK